MRISYWSSDVCSSDLVKSSSRFATANEEFRTSIFQHISNKALRAAIAQFNPHLHLIRAATLSDVDLRKDIVGRQIEVRDAIREIGRASCRERVCQYV